VSVLQPIISILTVPSVVLFPHALLDLKVAEGQLDCTAGEWLAEGALWGIATLRGSTPSSVLGHRSAALFRTVGIGHIVHRERSNGCIRRLVLEGLVRGRIVDHGTRPGVPAVQVEILRDLVNVEGARRKDLAREFAEMVRVARQVAASEADLRDVIRQVLSSHPHPGVVADLLAHNCVRDLYARQSILAELDVGRRVRLVQIQLAQIINHQTLQPLRRFR